MWVQKQVVKEPLLDRIIAFSLKYQVRSTVEGSVSGGGARSLRRKKTGPSQNGTWPIHRKCHTTAIPNAHLSFVLIHFVRRRWGVGGFPGAFHRERGTRRLQGFAKECLL